jgi:hypothetical protein
MTFARLFDSYTELQYIHVTKRILVLVTYLYFFLYNENQQRLFTTIDLTPLLIKRLEVLIKETS